MLDYIAETIGEFAEHLANGASAANEVPARANEQPNRGISQIIDGEKASS
jgi:hypothetical protein